MTSTTSSPGAIVVSGNYSTEQCLNELWKELSIASRNVRAAMDAIVWLLNNPKATRRQRESLRKIFRVTKGGSLRLQNTLLTTKGRTNTTVEDSVLAHLLARHHRGWVQDWIDLSKSNKQGTMKIFLELTNKNKQ